MKKLVLLISLLFYSTGCSHTEGRFTEMLTAVRNIEGGLHEQFLVTGKPLPRSLNEIELLNEIAARKPESAMLFNEMTVVPGAPVIHKAPGIATRHIQWRLFAIGRTINTDDESSRMPNGDKIPGRYSVWISPDGKYCAPGRTPETEIQAALKQIGGFDPSTQPVSFPEAENMARENMERKRNHQRDAKIQAVKNALPMGSTGGGKDSPWTLWLALVMPFFALIAWLAFRLIRRKQKGKDR